MCVCVCVAAGILPCSAQVAQDSERAVAPVCEDKTSQQQHKQYLFMFRYFIEYNFALMAVAHSFAPLHCTFFIFIAILYIE